MRHLGTMADAHLRRRRLLQAVAAFEFSKGVFVVLMGFCAIALVHKDTWLIAQSLPAARIAFAYAALRFTEAYGLWRERTWAEWIAFVSGTLLLPFEVRELLRGVTFLRCGLLVGNLAIVCYMLYVILVNRRERRNAMAVLPLAENPQPKPN